MNTIHHDRAAGVLTWTLQREFRGDVSDSVRNAAENCMDQVLKLFMDAFHADEPNALNLLNKMGNLFAHVEINLQNTIKAVKARGCVHSPSKN
jgi:hypothetical protein